MLNKNRQLISIFALSSVLFGHSAHADLTTIRSIDGSNNNASNPNWGQAHSQLQRLAPSAYAGDGSGTDIVEAPARPNARDISNAVAAQGDVNTRNNRGMSHFVFQWGQFLDHDIDLTEGSASNGTAPISVQAGDPIGPGSIPFNRSNFDASTGSTAANPREQVNEITAYIDGSMVYGSDTTTANNLRTFAGGKLATSGGELLPVDGSGMFEAGDIRANEQLGLTAMHTLFVREHNRLADEFAAQDPTATDEELYQKSRKVVGAIIQRITYEEFLPTLLGSNAVDPQAFIGNYDASVNAGIANEFSTSAFRFGHSLLPSELSLINTDGTDAGAVSLRDAFFNPDFYLDDPDNIDRILAGLARDQAQEIDNLLVDDIRNFLFGPPGAGGLDLAALNIQRGRDHGLPDYNTLRVALGLAPVTSFMDISSDAEVVNRLQSVYSDVDSIDAWVGGLAEDHLDGASVGELIAHILNDQFGRLAAGDSFFYLNDPDLQHTDILAVIDIRDTSLSDVIKANTDITILQNNVFAATDVPVPASLALLGAGLLVLAGKRRKA